jgi:RNA polymerase sigma-70 factor (sigma-E family)
MSDERADGRTQFAAFFAARHDLVRRTAYLLCGDWHFADDLSQLTFVRLAAGWHRIQKRESLDSYVQTILLRTFLAEKRRWFRRRESTTTDLADTAPDGTAGEMADAVGRRLAVTAALRRLPPGQRAVVVARYFADLDVSTTADALGCTPGTVKSQTARALRALREHLSGFALTIDEEEVPDGSARTA